MYTLYNPEHREFDSLHDVLAYLATLPATSSVYIEAPAGRYTGLDTIPFNGTPAEVTEAMRYVYGGRNR